MVPLEALVHCCHDDVQVQSAVGQAGLWLQPLPVSWPASHGGPICVHTFPFHWPSWLHSPELSTLCPSFPCPDQVIGSQPIKKEALAHCVCGTLMHDAWILIGPPAPWSERQSTANIAFVWNCGINLYCLFCMLSHLLTICCFLISFIFQHVCLFVAHEFLSCRRVPILSEKTIEESVTSNLNVGSHPDADLANTR